MGILADKSRNESWRYVSPRWRIAAVSKGHNLAYWNFSTKAAVRNFPTHSRYLTLLPTHQAYMFGHPCRYRYAKTLNTSTRMPPPITNKQTNALAACQQLHTSSYTQSLN